jgi:biopolymer transport protein ExbD
MLISLAERGKNVRIGCCGDDDDDDVPATTETKTTNKPMEAKALAALIKELKGVVTGITPDKNEAKLVGKRWDARKDLAGKTKSAVIELLYEDVKAVIKDSGTQYQIYSIFSFSKNIPDESPSAETKKTDVVVKKSPVKLTLNNEEHGTTADTSVLAKKLEEIFKEREKFGVFREGTNEIAKAVYLAGDRSVPAEEIAKLFGVLNKSRAYPILIPVPLKEDLIKPNPLALVVYAGSGESPFVRAGIEIGFIGELAENPANAPADKKPLLVAASKNGTYTMDGKQISAKDLKIKIESSLRAKEKSKKLLFVNADSYENIEDAASIAASAGASKVYVITKNIEHKEYGISFSLSPAYLKDKDHEQIPENPSVRFMGSDSSFEITLSDELFDKERAESEIKIWSELKKERFKQAEVPLTQIDGSSGVLTIHKDAEDYQASWFGFRKKNGKQQMVMIDFNSSKKESNYSHYEFLQIMKSIKFN